MPVLDTVFSRADALKRQLYDMLTNPRDYASMVAGRTQEASRAAQTLQEQAFSNPDRPFQITNPQALSQLTQMIMGGPLGFAPAGITAYHGSPYLFRQFDPAKIGAGEGAQAYGVGAGYTAESRGVAESYKDVLASPRNQVMSSRGIYIEPSPMGDNTWRIASSNTMLDGAPIGRAGDFTQGMTDYNFKNVASAIKYAKNKGWLDKNQKVNLTEIAEEGKYNPVRSVADMENPQYNQLIASQTGYLYKGDIPEEILPKFLDWDKPFKEQTPEVKDAIQKYWKENNVYGDPTKLSGAGVYDSVVAHLFGDAGRVGAQKAASDTLENIGIRGIRYLDQGSRGEGKGTSNFIPFRSEDYKIQEINDIPIEQWYAKGLLEPGNMLPKQYDDVTKLAIPKEFGGLKTEDYLFHGGVKGKLTPSEITSFSKSPQEALEYTTVSGGDMAAIPKSALNIYEGGNKVLTEAAKSNNLQALKDAGYDGFDLRSVAPGGYREVMVWNLEKALDKALYAPVGNLGGEIGITQPLRSLLD